MFRRCAGLIVSRPPRWPSAPEDAHGSRSTFLRHGHSSSGSPGLGVTMSYFPAHRLALGQVSRTRGHGWVSRRVASLVVKYMLYWAKPGQQTPHSPPESPCPWNCFPEYWSRCHPPSPWHAYVNSCHTNSTPSPSPSQRYTISQLPPRRTTCPPSVSWDPVALQAEN